MSWLDRFMRAFLPLDAAESLSGDLHEEWQHAIVPRYGRPLATLWVVLQAVALILRFLLQTLSSDQWRGFGGDIRFAARSLRKVPGFLAIVVTTLAFGIGANTAIFSVVNAVVLRPLPFREPDRLVYLFESHVPNPSDDNVLYVRPGNYHDWKRQNRVFESITAYSNRRVTLTGSGQAEVIWSHRVALDFFETLGTQPELGRIFLRDEYRETAERVAILSDTLWRNRFGADPAILNRNIALDNAVYRIVGVMPAGFYPTSINTPQIWTPLVFNPQLEQSRVDWLLLPIGRLKSGVTLQQARADLETIAAGIRERYPEVGKDSTVGIKPLPAFIRKRPTNPS